VASRRAAVHGPGLNRRRPAFMTIEMTRSPLPVALAAVALAACAPPPPAPPVIGSTGGEPAPASAPLPPPRGTYYQPHTIEMVCDQPDWCEEEVTDALTARPIAGGRLAVTIELVQTNAHTCTFEQELEPVPGDRRRWRFHAGEDHDEGPCDLVVIREPDRIDVESEGCRYYCGARAYLEASFPATPGP